MHQMRRHACASLLGALTVAACAAPPAPSVPETGETSRVSSATRARALPVAANRGVLRGELLVPLAGVIANHGARLVANNSAGVITNNGAGYRLRAQTGLVEPAADVEVAAFDLVGRRIPGATGRTDARGRFELRGLGASAAVIVLKATLFREGHSLELSSMVAAPRDGVVEGVRLDPASSLVARKVAALIARDGIDPASLTPDGLASAAAALAPSLEGLGVAIAGAGGLDQAAETLDALLAGDEALRGEVDRAAGAAVAKALPPPPAAGTPAVGATPPTATAPPVAPPIAAAPGATPDAHGQETPGPTPSQLATNAPVAGGPTGSPPPVTSASPAATTSPAAQPTASPVAAPGGANVSTLAGGSLGDADGTGGNAEFDDLTDVALAPNGDLIVVDDGNDALRRVTPAGVVTTWKRGNGSSYVIGDLDTVAIDGQGRAYLPESGAMNAVMARFTDGGAKEAFASLSLMSVALGLPRALAFGPDGGLHYWLPDITGLSSTLHRLSTAGEDAVARTSGGEAITFTGFGTITDTAIAPDGKIYLLQNHRILLVRSTGAATVLAGAGAGFANGSGSTARFSSPKGLAIAPDGSVIVADTGNHRIRRMTPEGLVSTIAGSGTRGFDNGAPALATLDDPFGVAVAADGTVYVADQGNHAIRRFRLP